MKKENTFYIVLAVLAVIIVIAVVFYFRYKALEKQLKEGASNLTSSTPPSNGGTGSTSTGTGSTITTPAYHGSDTTKWRVGDILKATKPLNVYDTPAASTSNIQSTFAAGESGMKFMGMENGYAKVSYPRLYGYLFPIIDTGYIFVNNNLVN